MLLIVNVSKVDRNATPYLIPGKAGIVPNVTGKVRSFSSSVKDV